MEEVKDARSEGSVIRGALWMLVLSLVGMIVPPFGFYFAGVVGGRIARAPINALKAVVVPALLFALIMWLSSNGGIEVNKVRVFLPPILAIVPPIALIAGALTGATGISAKLAGLAALIVSIIITYSSLGPILKTVRQLQPPKTADEHANRLSCSENLRRLHSAALLYADSWDDMLPPADRWQDVIKEKASDDGVFHCPSVGKDGSKFGYAMNTALGGKRWKDVKDAARTPLFYDSTNLGANAHDAYSSLPAPGRHEGKNYVLFLDGHVAER